MNVVMEYAPEVVDSIRELSEEKELKGMGSCGVSSYYCHNYISPQHTDKDEGWSICSQLFKEMDAAGGDNEKDFNFAFTKWGLYIQTEANCVW